MEPGRTPYHPTARFLVRIRDDSFVSIETYTCSCAFLIFIYSVLIPWFTIREVKVDIEIVRNSALDGG